jgi:hypothetical protein
MSYYYQYNFVSPEPLYAEIKEDFKSYFDAGMIDDLMFPIWTERCTQKLRKSAFKIQEAMLFIEDFKSTLPSDFQGVREAWICGEFDPVQFNANGACYSKITTKLGDTTECGIDSCDPCEPCGDLNRAEFFFKTNTSQFARIAVKHLLKPGNIATIKSCGTGCPNITCSSIDTFDIHGNQFTTNFRTGNVYLTYYSSEFDEEGFQQIPDNEFIREYIKSYIQWKLMLQLWNQVTDETYNQIQSKVQYYEGIYYSKLADALTETKKQDITQKRNSLIRTKRSLNRYNIR